MPSRILREGILTSEAVNSLSESAEILYRRLFSVVDDYGRYFGHVALVRAACYPLQLETVSESKVDALLAEIESKRLMLLYTVSGKKYIEINNFKQRTRTASKYPAPCQTNDGQMTVIMSDSPPSFDNPNARLVGGVVVCVDEGGGDTHSTRKSSKKFTPPTEQEVIDYFLENGYTQQSAKKAFKYYQSNDWKDAKDSPVKNWKQKMISVWFKDENKLNGHDKPDTPFDKAQRIAKEKGYEKFKGHAHESPEQFVKRISVAEGPPAQH